MLVIVIRCAVLKMWSFPLTCPLPIKLMSSPNFSIHVYLTCIWQDCVKRWDWELSVSTWEELGRAEGKWLWLPLTYVTGNIPTCQLCVRASEAAVWLMFEGCAHVHADVAWLSFVKFQTCEFEAHCELKIALKKKQCVYHLNSDSWPIIRAGRDLWISLIFPVQTPDEDSDAWKVN